MEKSDNVNQRLSTFIDKNLEEEQMYFNIHRILLVILIVLILGMALLN
jgi:hypothetical protein